MRDGWLVFLGGGFGSVLRWMLARALNPFMPHFFWGTFGANALGSLLIGLLWGWTSAHPDLAQRWQPLLMIGFCGGFTTYSTFSLEAVALLRAGHVQAFTLHVATTLVACLCATALGVYLARPLAG